MENRKRVFIIDTLKTVLKNTKITTADCRTDNSFLTRSELRNLIEYIEDNDIVLVPFT